MVTANITLLLNNGMPAKSASAIAEAMSRYESSVHIIFANKKVNAKSIMGIMGLGLDQGKIITIEAEGTDEEVAIAALEEFLGN